MTLEFHPESETKGLEYEESYFVISSGSPFIAIWTEDMGWYDPELGDTTDMGKISIEWWAEIPTDYKKW